MNTSNILTNHAQRGTLIYQNPDFTFTITEGWFHLQGNTVVMRKIRGRNQFQLCNITSVDEFTPYDEEAKSLRAHSKYLFNAHIQVHTEQ